MTARELIETLQNLGEEYLDKQVLVYDKCRYVDISEIRIVDKPTIYDYSEEPFIGIN